MKTPKFVCSDEQQKKFAHAVRMNVNNYFTTNGISTKGDLSLVIQTIAMLSLYIIPFVMILTIKMNIWIALLFAVIMGTGMAGIGMCVMHDAIHGSYSDKKSMNKILGGTMYLIGSSVFNWKIQHNVMHHAYTNIEGLDPDIESRIVIRFSEHDRLRKVQRYQYIHGFFFYGLMTLSKLVTDFIELIKYNKAGITRKHHLNPIFEYVKMTFAKMLYLFVFVGLPIIITGFAWWQVLLLFLMMHWTTGCILSSVFEMAHVVEGAEQPMPDADGNIHNEWSVHQLKTTSDFARNNLFLNWYVGGLNFQIEHHLFPNICHIHYRKIAPIVEQTAKQYGITYNLKPTFTDALASHIRRLKALGMPAVQVAG